MFGTVVQHHDSFGTVFGVIRLSGSARDCKQQIALVYRHSRIRRTGFAFIVDNLIHESLLAYLNGFLL